MCEREKGGEVLIDNILRRCSAGFVVFEDEQGRVGVRWKEDGLFHTTLGLAFQVQRELYGAYYEERPEEGGEGGSIPGADSVSPSAGGEFLTTLFLVDKVLKRWPSAVVALAREGPGGERDWVGTAWVGSGVVCLGLTSLVSLELNSLVTRSGFGGEKVNMPIALDEGSEVLGLAGFILQDEPLRFGTSGRSLEAVGLADQLRYQIYEQRAEQARELGGEGGSEG